MHQSIDLDGSISVDMVVVGLTFLPVLAPQIVGLRRRRQPLELQPRDTRIANNVHEHRKMPCPTSHRPTILSLSKGRHSPSDATAVPKIHSAIFFTWLSHVPRISTGPVAVILFLWPLLTLRKLRGRGYEVC